MPIIKVYRGSIDLRAGKEIHSESFYRYSKKVYGETLGELFDNLVEAAVIAAEEARMWIVTHDPFTDSMNVDYWQATVTLPNIIKCQERKLSDYLDSAFTMRVRSVSEIVAHSVGYRHSSISMANTFLQLSLPGASNLPESSAIKLIGCDEAGSLAEMTKYGWTGTELEEILEIARKENRIDAHNAKLKYDRRLSAFDADCSGYGCDRTDSGKGTRKKKWFFF